MKALMAAKGSDPKDNVDNTNNWNRKDEPVSVTGPETLLTEFGIHLVKLCLVKLVSPGDRIMMRGLCLSESLKERPRLKEGIVTKV